MKAEKYKVGFVYEFEVVQNGKVVQAARNHNLVPNQGFEHILGVTLRGSLQIPNWYVGLYGNNYTPIPTDTIATFPSAAGEITAYVGSTRKAFTPAAPTGGVISNSLSKAEFEINGEVSVTVRGGFIASSSAKGAATGVLLSAVRATDNNGQPTEFILPPGSILRVSAGFEFSQA